MKYTTLTYHQTINTGNYENNKLSLTVEFDDEYESIDEVYFKVKSTVNNLLNHKDTSKENQDKKFKW